MDIFGLLVDPAGQVLATSFPARYPAPSNVAQELPAAAPLIQAALAGKPGSVVENTPQGSVASVAQTVWGLQNRPIGAPTWARRWELTTRPC